MWPGQDHDCLSTSGRYPDVLETNMFIVFGRDQDGLSAGWEVFAYCKFKCKASVLV